MLIFLYGFFLFQEVRELLDLQRNYFLLIHAMTTQELSPVMLSQKSSPLLQNIIGLLLDASCNHKDVLVRKVDFCLFCPYSRRS